MKKINSGFKILDKSIGGFCGGELIVIGSRPYMNKELFMERFAIKIASIECSVLYLFNQFNQFNLTKLVEKPFISMFSSSFEIGELSDKIIKEVITQNIKIVCIDNLERISYASSFLSTDVRKKVAYRLQKLAKKLQIPIVVLSELSEKVETRQPNNIKPKLVDLNGVQNRADKIILINRLDYYGLMEDAEGESTEGIYTFDVFNKTSKVQTRIKFDLNTNINEFIELKTAKIY